MNKTEATITVDGLGCQTIEEWSGNLHLGIDGHPVVVGVEYKHDRGFRVDFVRFLDSGGSSVYDGMDLTYDTIDNGWQGIPSPEQRRLLLRVLELTSKQLEEMTAQAGRYDLWN